eukprot:1144111-Pelagomonas_calceolata.AAC.5
MSYARMSSHILPSSPVPTPILISPNSLREEKHSILNTRSIMRAQTIFTPSSTPSSSDPTHLHRALAALPVSLPHLCVLCKGAADQEQVKPTAGKGTQPG